MTHARHALSLTAGAAAVLGLMATPASAHLRAGSAPSSAAVVLTHSYSDAGFTLAELRSLLDAKLAGLASRVAADRAQWSEVASSTVLSPTQRRAAVADLFASKGALAVLAAVEARGIATAAEQERIDELQADLRSLVTKLKALLDNRPAVTPTSTRAVSAPAAKPTMKTRADRHVCDHDGFFGGSGDRTWDRHRWDGARWDGRR